MGKFEKQTSLEGFKPYKDWELPDIIKWCQENNQIDWLKAKANETRERPIYPKKKVPKLDENGNPLLTKAGKPRYSTITDKTAEPIGTETDKISFVELKSDFLHKFNLVAPKPEKKVSMYDLIKAL